MTMDYFAFKGVDSRTMGVKCLELPPITAAQERATFEKVAGRSGTVAILEGENVLEDMTLNMTCLLDDMARLDEVFAWLRGRGALALPNRPGGHYVGRIVNQLELKRVIAASDKRQFTLSVRCDPYWYLEANDIEITTSGASIVNPCNAESLPRVTVHGSGSVALRIGGQVVTLNDLDGGIVLDSDLMDALSLDGVQLLNGHMTGEFFRLAPGTSLVSWGEVSDAPGGSVTRVVIEPRWRNY